MKHFVLSLLCLLASATFCFSAEASYGLKINSDSVVKATPMSETDYQGRTQYKVSCLALEVSDTVRLIDLSNNATWMIAPETGGSSASFSYQSAEGCLVCTTSGTYDFYIKLKYQDDALYIGSASGCEPVEEGYYLTGDSALLGKDLAWKANAVKLENDTAVVKGLAIGSYKLKLTDGTWSHSWGYSAFSSSCSNIGATSDSDGNVVITINKATNLIVVFSGTTICLTTTVEQDPEPEPYASAVPSKCHDVMLQAFYYDSYSTSQPTTKYGDTKWTTLLAQAGEISAYFDLVWLPPSAQSSGGTGYHPSRYCKQSSDWGSRGDLQTLISRIHDNGGRVVGDIVLNHINNKSTWCDFFAEDFGEYGLFEPQPSWICSTDEMNTDSKAGECKGQATGAADDGYGSEANYAAARDWDHNNSQVREMARAYLKWLRKEIGYDGWRYDYCKGFHNSHINDYNKASECYFSVMEYWDGDVNVLREHLNDAENNTLTFDFATKYTAFNNGIAAGNYSGCKGAGLLGAGLSKYAVTFVDSHDSFQRDDNEMCGKNNSMNNPGKILQANAYILAMPGIPCVFYPHWYKFKSSIAPMINARHIAGIHSESEVKDESASSTGYQCTVEGDNGYLILCLGDKSSATFSGYTRMASGDGYAIWVKTNSDVAPRLNITPGASTFSDSTKGISVSLEAIGGTSTATIYYTTDGSEPTTASLSLNEKGTLTFNETTTLKAMAVCGTAQSKVLTYTYTYRAPQTTPITIRFHKPDSWEQVCLYAWLGVGTTKNDGTVLNGGWPGKAMTIGEDGWYTYTAPATVADLDFIISDGTDEMKSADLYTACDVCYQWEGCDATIDDECAPIDVPFSLYVTPEGQVFKDKTKGITISLLALGCESDATIYYTTDGSTPTTASASFQKKGTLSFYETTTLKAVAVCGGEQTEVKECVYTYKEPQTTAITVRFNNTASWSKVSLYAWSADDKETPYLGKWPGTTLTADAEGWYSYTFADSIRLVNFIFSNGGSPQTQDLQTDEDVCYAWNATTKKGVLLPDCQLTAVDDIERATMVLYPNPVGEVLFVRSESDIQQIAVYGLTGEQVLTTTANEVDMRSLTSGIYLVRILTTSGTLTTERIIKQ